MRQAGRQADRVMKRPSVRYSGNWLLGRRAAFSREIVCKTRPPTASHPLPANQSTETTGDTTMALALVVVRAEIQIAGLERHFNCVHRVVMICTACVHSVVTICTACAHTLAINFEHCPDEQPVFCQATLTDWLVCVLWAATGTLAHWHTQRTVCHRPQKLMTILTWGEHRKMYKVRRSGVMEHGYWTIASQMVGLCTTELNGAAVFVCFVWIWEQTAIISLYNINWLVFITDTECVYCAVRTGYLNFSPCER
jgi:hypothetical protein